MLSAIGFPGTDKKCQYNPFCHLWFKTLPILNGYKKDVGVLLFAYPDFRPWRAYQEDKQRS